MLPQQTVATCNVILNERLGVFKVGAFQSDVLINYAVCKLYENINLVLGLKNLQYLFCFYKLILEY